MNETEYGVGLCPKTPVKCPGSRDEPAISDVSPIKEAPDANKADSPPEDPPLVNLRLCGFRVRPVTVKVRLGFKRD